MCCSRENPQTSVALHFCTSPSKHLGTACGRLAVTEKRAAPHVLPLSHPGQQNPDPVTHACDMSRHRLIWWYSTLHLLHLAYDITMRTALKPVLDWALKSASLDWGKIMLCATVSHHHCCIQSKRKHCAMIISLILTGTETHFYCPSHRTRSHSTVSIS